MKVLGFTGAMGSGKSTAIQYLKKYVDSRNRSEPVFLIKFAQPLYDMQEYIYDRIEPVYERGHEFVKDRRLLQWLGTEWGRGTISETLWTDIWQNEVQQTAKSFPNSIVVCDDVRYDNESGIIKGLEGAVIKIQSDRTGDRIDTKSGIPNHRSEGGISGEQVDVIIENSGSIEEFEDSLQIAFNWFFNR